MNSKFPLAFLKSSSGFPKSICKTLAGLLIYLLNFSFSFSTILFVFSLIVWHPVIITKVTNVIKNKTDSIVEKENEKLSKYISKPASVLQMDLGKPDEDFKNAKGNFEFIYNTKKYGIPCERRFEINSESIVIGFVSNGCF